MKNINMDGHMWQTLINRYLPNLNIFNLNMDMDFDDSNSIQDQVDRLIESFNTKFWIDQHKCLLQFFLIQKIQ